MVYTSCYSTIVQGSLSFAFIDFTKGENIMKKIFTLVLVLVLAFCLSVPAMAFTSDSEADDDSVPYGLKIYLVEYDDNDLFGFVTLPESDRGYAKNEIVAAVVELDIPEDEDIVGDGYTMLEITGDNVDYDVTDEPLMSADTDDDGLDLISDGDDGWHVGTAGMGDDVTYKWLVFAKVTDDEASMTAKLIDGTEADEFVGNSPSTLALTLEGEDYLVIKFAEGYAIEVHSGDYEGAVILIDVDDDNVSEGMTIVCGDDSDYDGEDFALGVNTKNELGIVKGAVIDTDGDDFDDVMDIYEDVVVDVFGMDYFLIGNYVRDSYFEGLTSSDTVVATVDIEPWTAYVTVPDNIVVDPPKTGDAASIMGFVMVALSGAGVVALRKRG